MPGLLEWNARVLDVVQVLWGVVSPNFRMVAIDHKRDKWLLRFVLERDDVEDREEIEDLGAEFEALQNGPIDFEIEVLVSDGALSWPPPPTRVVYRRREP